MWRVRMMWRVVEGLMFTRFLENIPALTPSIPSIPSIPSTLSKEDK
jgi:hypothetical protein